MSCCLTTSDRRPAVILVSGVSGSGKTTLIERLIPRLRARRLRVGTVKHAHHGFEMDRPGKDTWRHAKAGSSAVAVIAPARAAWLLETPRELPLARAVALFGGRVDLVLVEGFTRQPGPKIYLKPGTSPRLTVGRLRCRVGVRPRALTTVELGQLAAFCVRLARTHRIAAQEGRS